MNRNTDKQNDNRQAQVGNNRLIEYVRDQIWIYEYPIRYAGINLFGRMTVIRLVNDELLTFVILILFLMMSLD